MIKGKRMIKRISKYVLVILAVLLAALYFRPRSIWDVLDPDLDPNGTAYCTCADISQGHNSSWSGPEEEMLSPSAPLLGPLLHQVSVSGPVFYKNGALNADLANLYLALPQKDGSYQRASIELILSYGSYESDSYSAFINIDNKGYFVTSGKTPIFDLLQRARGG